MNQQKQLLKILILPFLFTFSSSMPMLTSLFKQTLQKFTQSREGSEITRIRQLATIADVDHEIDMIKDDVYDKTLKEIKNLSDIPYDTVRLYFDFRRGVVKNVLETSNPLINQEHDKNIPSSIYNDLISLLKDNSIDPKNVTLKYENSSEKGLLADARGANINVQTYPDFEKPRIRLFSQLIEEPKSNKLFTYQHELSHILLEHSFMQRVVLSHIEDPKHCNLDQLTSLNEQEADIHAASKNIQLASAGVQSRCTYGHIAVINPLEHCQVMITLYALMLQKEKLSTKASSC